MSYNVHCPTCNKLIIATMKIVVCPYCKPSKVSVSTSSSKIPDFSEILEEVLGQ